MKMFDYSGLIRVIDNVEIREEKERVMDLLKKKEKCNKLERFLVESGILDDWNRLKYLCAKAKVRLCVSNMGDNSIGYVLGINDYGYGYCKEYDDNGMIKKLMSSGSHWSDYYGFTYEADKGIIWKAYHTTNTHHFNRFRNEDEEYETKINLLETFKNTYEIYREFQLKKIEDKFATRIKVEDILK